MKIKKSIKICGNGIQRIMTVLDGKITEQVSEFIHLANTTTFASKDMELKIRNFNKICRIIQRFRKQTSSESQIIIKDFMD
jgi:hypothetical protein